MPKTRVWSELEFWISMLCKCYMLDQIHRILGNKIFRLITSDDCVDFSHFSEWVLVISIEQNKQSNSILSISVLNQMILMVVNL